MPRTHVQTSMRASSPAKLRLLQLLRRGISPLRRRRLPASLRLQKLPRLCGAAIALFRRRTDLDLEGHDVSATSAAAAAERAVQPHM